MAVDSSLEFMNLGLRQWETPHALAWVQSSRTKPDVKALLVKAVTEEELTGEDLLDLDDEELVDEWGLTPMHAGIFQRKVKAARREYRGFDPKEVATTDAPGVIGGETDGPPRARMPCDHGVTASNMFLYLTSELKRPTAEDVVCPAVGCSRVWPWPLCAKVAGLDEAEALAMGRVYMSKRMRECPWCKSFIVRPDSISQKRVACPCGGADFCFDCLVKWQWPGLQICRADGCSSTRKNQILANCQMKKPKYIDQTMPSIRACPKCHSLIEHTEACKHMTCTVCSPATAFCFVCLGIRTQDGWPCGSHTTKCETAPIQFLEE